MTIDPKLFGIELLVGLCKMLDLAKFIDVFETTSKPKQVDLSMSRAQERLAKAKDEMHEAVSSDLYR